MVARLWVHGYMLHVTCYMLLHGGYMVARLWVHGYMLHVTWWLHGGYMVARLCLGSNLATGLVSQNLDLTL